MILRLAISNLRKKKGLTVTLVLLSALASLFLNMGLIMSRQMDRLFPLCAQRLQSPDLFVLTEASKYKTSFEAFLQTDDRVDFLEKEEVIYQEISRNSANSSRAGAVLFNIDTPRKIEPPRLLEQDPTVDRETAIYLPKVMKGNGISLGDPFTLTLENVEYSFQVAGFFETSYMGTSGYAFMKYYLPQESFQKLYETVGTGKALSVRMKDGLPKRETSSGLIRDFLNETNFYTEIGGTMVVACCLSYEDMETTIVSLFAVPMTIMISVAFIICIINFIIVFFKVKEEMDDSMTNIGSLLAMGYTTGQIIRSKVMEFVIAGGWGALLGVLFTYAALPLVASNVEGMIGILVTFTGHPGEDLFSALVIILLLSVSALSAAWRIRSITPVTALRKGVRTHHFGRNFFPLDHGAGSLYLRLALKNICTDYRQNMMTAFSIGLGVFAIGVTIVLYMNMGYNHTTIEQMTGIEIADIQVKPLPGVSTAALEQELGNREEVRKTNRSESYIARVGEDNIQLTVCSDFDKTDYLNVLEGSFPKYDNEIVITTSFMNRLGKSIGDMIPVTAKGITAEYMIVGTSMGTNMNGRMGMMSEEGLKRIDPYYEITSIDLYLEEGVSRGDFMNQLRLIYGDVHGQEGTGLTDQSEDLEEAGQPGRSEGRAEARKRAEEKMKKLLDQYGLTGVAYAVMKDGEILLSGSSTAYRIKEVSSLSEYLDGQLKSYAAMMTGMMAMIVIVMLLVMGTIISITVSSLLRRQRAELGIYRSFGFTTGELVRVIRLNFTVDAVLGSLLGILMCGLFANQLLCLFFRSLMVDIAGLEVNPFWLAVVGILTVLYVSLLTTYKARQVKKVTVYELLSE